ncbi:MAG: class I SAM-dependent methyltransferase [Kiloniellaceae bacterium]
MSVFEDYDRTSRHYDRTRVPVGAEIILGCLARHAKPLNELAVLDAGCGTGAYSRAIVDRVGRIDAIDLSEGMLAQARAKLAPQAAAGRVRFHRGSIADLPFAAGSFDAAMINQVVHHLGDTAEDGFSRLRRVVGEFARVLRPGGVLVFNHCSQEQLRHAYWYHDLIPRAQEAMCRRFAPLETLRAIFEAAGFVNRGGFVPVDAVCQGEAYFEGRGPLRKAWRDGDSIWALVEEGELSQALARVRALDAAGRLEAFVAEHDARRPSIGQVTFLFATRAEAAAA